MHCPGLAIAGLCAEKGIRHVVISPGSRSGPLTAGFARCGNITVHISLDERSAGYLAMGIAQQSGTPTALVCTSGTAALNYCPAVAEAYYQQVPLVVITADRPPEWIGQQDGQAVHQPDVYGKHCKRCFNLPVDTEHRDGQWHFFRSISEALNLAEEGPKGPVQINVPIREPFYDALLSGDGSQPDYRIIETVGADLALAPAVSNELRREVGRARRIVVLVGQSCRCNTFRALIGRLAAAGRTVVVGDVLANLQGIEGVIHSADGLLNNTRWSPDPEFDLLISFGRSVLSKNLKNYLRSCRIQQHWHVQPYGQAADTFQKLTRVIRQEPVDFVKDVLLTSEGQQDENSAVDQHFIHMWQLLGENSAQLAGDFFQQPSEKKEQRFGEFQSIFRIMEALPHGAVLHLSNSMTVRYASLAGIGGGVAEVFANRGTSGIDGCLSTALGHALADPGRPHWLLIGDIAFFYDRNALWRTDWPDGRIPANFTIVVINNSGGGIFNMIGGARDLPEAERYFVCGHRQEAKRTAEDSGLDYIRCTDDAALSSLRQPAAGKPNRPRLIEIVSDRKADREVFSRFQAFCKAY